MKKECLPAQAEYKKDLPSLSLSQSLRGTLCAREFMETTRDARCRRLYTYIHIHIYSNTTIWLLASSSSSLSSSSSCAFSSVKFVRRLSARCAFKGKTRRVRPRAREPTKGVPGTPAGHHPPEEKKTNFKVGRA